MTPLDLVALALAAPALVAIGAAAAVGRREHRQLLQVEGSPLREPLLVVIAARNEAANLHAHLPALLSERSQTLQVVVVDDGSTDETAAVVTDLANTDARLRLLSLTDALEPGVFGKPRALAAAVEDARARGALPALTLFLDADMQPRPGLLGALVAALRRERAHAVSGVPRLLLRSASEALFLPTLVALLTGGVRASRVHSAGAPDAFLNGQVMLVDTSALDKVGGWRAVRSTVLEDVALARLMKHAGLTLRLADLRALVATRMYSSYREMARGFGKNATALLGPKAGALGALSFLLSLMPWLAAGLALASAAASGARLAPMLVLVMFLATIIVQAKTRLDVQAPVWPVLLLPVSYLGAALILMRASLAHRRRAPLEWRGRRYPR